ncbi:alpha-crystallin A chain-like [Nymphalis io]|uniref:alpha-crystallin A chain-like n=1 Tax=Inachis io TaxID=171585 RepID=UPI002168646B|nr:alpha-crystallin A chain-like [Nymphalis io]
MSYLPYVCDFDRHNRMPLRYATSFMPENLFEAIDVSDLEYFPKLSKFNGVGKPSKDRFEVYLDVEDYGPDDITVKTIDGFVVIEGQHKEKRDEYGWVKRQFYRRCPLPEGYKTKALLSQYSSDGTLIITAALVKCNEGKCEMPVQEKNGGEGIPTKKNQDDAGAESGDGENESEKKPVKPKPANEDALDPTNNSNKQE